MKPTSSTQARLKLAEAMVLVEEAQHTLERACQKLSSVRAGSDLWKKVSKLARTSHDLFYVLADAERFRPGMSVDSECSRCLTDLSGWKHGDPPHHCTKP